MWINPQSLVGWGCGPTNEEGPVRMRKLIARNNAYDISKPQTLMKLISAATQTTGTGITIGKTDEKFAFTEAMALMLARISIPVKGTVRDSNGKIIKDASIQFEKNPAPVNEVTLDPISALLKMALEL